MFGYAGNPSKAYAQVGVETGVVSANPHKLILMLFDGAMLAVADARTFMEGNRVPEKGAAISRAIDIITNGLKASIDGDAGGDLAAQLGALYEYMCMRLLHANLKNDPAALKEVAGLLGEIRGAWEEIANDPAVLSANQAAA